MFEMRYVSEPDQSFWLTLDAHISESELALKMRDKRGYIILDRGAPVGVMRYNLFWDNTPFLTLICLEESHRGKGFGTQAMLFWEDEMRALGYKVAMTSTRVDEEAQHFYRALGYQDKGALFLDHTPIEQPQELFLVKVLSPTM